MLFLRQRRLLFRDAGALRSHLRIEFFERLPFFGQVIFVEDRLDRALGNARLAIDAFIRMNVEDLVALVEAFDGANNNAVGVFATKARLSNHVSHD